jgi:hypothetical protein
MHDRVIDQDGPIPRSDTSGIGRPVKEPSHTIDQRESTTRLLRIIGNQGTQRMLPARDVASARAAEWDGAPEPDDNQRRSQDAGPRDAGPADAGPADAGPADAGTSAPSASFSIAGDGSYADTATESRKTVTFNATWSGGAKEDYIIVQWLKGYMKKPDGTAYKVTMYGSSVDFNFAAFQIDSLDEDPAYASKSGVRWRYSVDGPNKFSSTDSPGPMFDSDGAGAKARVDFKAAVYKSSDVPSKTSGSISATPLSSFATWTYYVNVLGGGKFDHK